MYWNKRIYKKLEIVSSDDNAEESVSSKAAKKEAKQKRKDEKNLQKSKKEEEKDVQKSKKEEVKEDVPKPSKKEEEKPKKEDKSSKKKQSDADAKKAAAEAKAGTIEFLDGLAAKIKAAKSSLDSIVEADNRIAALAVPTVSGTPGLPQYENQKLTRACMGAIVRYQSCLENPTHLGARDPCEPFRVEIDSYCPGPWLEIWKEGAATNKASVVGRNLMNIAEEGSEDEQVGDEEHEEEEEGEEEETKEQDNIRKKIGKGLVGIDFTKLLFPEGDEEEEDAGDDEEASDEEAGDEDDVEESKEEEED